MHLLRFPLTLNLIRCSDAARAIFHPIFPDEGLLIKRTGSKYSRVGPAVTRHFIFFIFLNIQKFAPNRK